MKWNFKNKLTKFLPRRSSAVLISILFCITLLSVPLSITYQTKPTSDIVSHQVIDLAGPSPDVFMQYREYSFSNAPIEFSDITPFGLTSDTDGVIWGTDVQEGVIFKIIPANDIDQNSTTSTMWPLPESSRYLSHIIYDDENENESVLWFTSSKNAHISKLNPTTNMLTDWPLMGYGIFPWDLVMDNQGRIWFTDGDDSTFCRLEFGVNHTTLVKYTFDLPEAGLFEIDTNGSSLYMTDRTLNNLYEYLIESEELLVYPQFANGSGTYSVSVDTENNIWTTQPLADVINDQIYPSESKTTLDVVIEYEAVDAVHHYIEPFEVYTPIHTSVVQGIVTNSTPEIFGDPIAVYNVPTAESRPYSITTDDAS